jgi:hypothetical protein
VPGISFRTDNGPFKVEFFFDFMIIWFLGFDGVLNNLIDIYIFFLGLGCNARFYSEDCPNDEE